MEKLIEKASHWYDNDLLVLNTGKISAMTVSTRNIAKTPILHFKGHDFIQTNKIKYLGTNIDNRINFKNRLVQQSKNYFHN